ncbi:TBC domain containing protein [Cryptosporidium ryanae]|uniref:TBC domain containing protein n=1 Tax=Cryptosporidium ryanae TaxID=515981 RepID=UPI003519EE25|nr:TBC domain containing protein [Cryptosporidium ryanae]
MIKSPEFWDKESKAPLLKRNANLFSNESKETDEHIKRAESWLEVALCPNQQVKSINECSNNYKCLYNVNLVPLDQGIEIKLLDNTSDPEINRIFKLDAERTFSDEENRVKMIKVLSTIYQEIKDYHQGLGFVVAFLLLQLKPEDTVRLALSLNRYYLPGYFKTAPFNYVRDAKVFEKLLLRRYPEVAKKIEDSACAEAFCSKWFVGLNVHVLPFPALCKFFEILFLKGNLFLFQFGLSVVDVCREDILNAKDASEVLAILRLDEKKYHNLMEHNECGPGAKPGSFFTHLVEHALDIDVTEDEINELREIIVGEMRLQEEKRKQREAELNLDDDEIVFSDEE